MIVLNNKKITEDIHNIDSWKHRDKARISQLEMRPANIQTDLNPTISRIHAFRSLHRQSISENIP